MLQQSEDRIVHAIDRLLIAINNGGSSGTVQTITSTSATDSTGSPIASGASSIGFTTSATFAGTINGVTRSASTFYGFSSANGERLPSIAYTVTSGSMVIDKIV